MSNDIDNGIELSPGFFDLNNPINSDYIAEIGNLIPDKINVENANNRKNTKNLVIEFFTLMIFNTTTKNCGCERGWSRTQTY